VSISRSGFYHKPAGETPLNLTLMRLIDEQFLETPWDNVFIERLWRSLKYECVVCCERVVSACDGAELYRRWGTAPRSRPAGADFKPPQAAKVKSLRGERCWKRRKLFRQVGLETTNASEPLMTCRNVLN